MCVRERVPLGGGESEVKHTLFLVPCLYGSHIGEGLHGIKSHVELILIILYTQATASQQIRNSIHHNMC